MSLTKFQGQFKSSQGFTLVEMIVVVAIVAILAVIAYPSMKRQLAEMRIKSAKESLVTAFKDAQAQSLILRKPIWVTIEKEPAQLVIIMTDTDPESQATRNVLSKTLLPQTVRITTGAGAEVSDSVFNNLKKIRVSPSGNFEAKKKGQDGKERYVPDSYTFAFCDTGAKKMVVQPVRFEKRSTPVPANRQITCNLR